MLIDWGHEGGCNELMTQTDLKNKVTDLDNTVYMKIYTPFYFALFAHCHQADLRLDEFLCL